MTPKGGGPPPPGEMHLVPIGTVEELPESPGCSRIRLLPEYAAGLRGIEDCELVWVLFWLDRVSPADRHTLAAHPQGDRSRPVRGIFALRSPRRPNPVGLTQVRLLAVEGDVLLVQGLDALPGTPVIDLKPVTEDC